MSTETVSPGRPWPLGVTPEGTGVNVAVWAPEADRVEFCVFGGDGAGESEQRHVLPYRDSEIRHAHIPGVGVGTRYGLRATGRY
ncbi:MAG: glycogen debranching protein GlgX, partial [Mycobacteriaceae bacterium]